MKKISRVFVVLILLFLSSPVKGAKPITKDKILKTGQEWIDNYKNYTADVGMIESIKAKIGTNLKIDVFLGLWCGDSINNVPKFIKILEAIASEDLMVNYFTVERTDKQGTPYFVQEFKVERVPTFIFYRNGKEIGRIIENPKKTLIEDFLELVF
jgi:hypothetical protein